MKIVNIAGGLGNQMFQYAFAQALQLTHPEESIYVDTHHYHTLFFKKTKGINLHNGYEIDKLFKNANLPVAQFWQIMKLSYYMPNYVLSRVIRKIFPKRNTEFIPPYSENYTYNESALHNKFDCYYEGFWQSIKYYSSIKEKLQITFAHPIPNEYNANLISKICNCNSVGIHIRRGDYLYEPEFRNICSIDYYKKAIERIKDDGKQHSFFIFSNDVVWCKENILPLVGNSAIEFVTGNIGKNSCWDMFLMEYCKDLIIANSSFSWWAAFLSKCVDRVVAPDPWLNRDCEIDIYEDNWIKLN